MQLRDCKKRRHILPSAPFLKLTIKGLNFNFINFFFVIFPWQWRYKTSSFNQKTRFFLLGGLYLSFIFCFAGYRLCGKFSIGTYLTRKIFNFCSSFFNVLFSRWVVVKFIFFKLLRRNWKIFWVRGFVCFYTKTGHSCTEAISACSCLGIIHTLYYCLIIYLQCSYYLVLTT